MTKSPAQNMPTRDFLPSFTNISSSHPHHHGQTCYRRTAIALAPLRCSPWFQLTPWQQGLWGRLYSHCRRGQLAPGPGGGAQKGSASSNTWTFPLSPPPSTQSFSLTNFTHFFCTPISRKSQDIPMPDNPPNPASDLLTLAQCLRRGGKDSSGPVMI